MDRNLIDGVGELGLAMMLETQSHASAGAYRVRQAVFLVGGKGTRLGALSSQTPKPLIEIGPGLRFLDLLLDQAVRHDFVDIILLAGHLGEQVEALYHGRKLRDATVSVVREPIPAGTGGALLHIADQLDRWFVMANGDSIFDIDLRALAKLDPPGAGARNDFVGRLALREVPDTARYGAVELCDDRIVAFREKSSAKARRGVINGGVYLLNRDILSKLKMPCSIEMDVFPALAKAGRLRGVQFDGYFLDIGLPEMLERAKREIPQRLAPAASI